MRDIHPPHLNVGTTIFTILTFWFSPNSFVVAIDLQKFLGNLVEDIATKTHLPIPVKARLIRFLPLGMMSSTCMRVELYGEKSSTESTGKWSSKK